MIIVLVSLTLSCVSAEDLDNNGTEIQDNNYLDYQSIDEDDSNPSYDIYVDEANGNDLNDGKSWGSPVKSFNQAIQLASDNSTIYLADGNYIGLKNTKIVIDKSLNVVGSSNTIFNGQNSNYLFTIQDNVVVTFKNIKFINSYKKAGTQSLNGTYGSVLYIKNAKVTIENCSFKNNLIKFDDMDSKYLYGGAISNFGDLTIINSYFSNNTIITTSGLFGYGGSIYNNGRLAIDNSSFISSKSGDFVYGGFIANNGDLVINNSIIQDSFSAQECKGSAIYNSGNLTLLNSIIENNTISRSNFYLIYGAIYNAGNLVAQGNIFRKNNGVYAIPNDYYKGSPTIYNVGIISLRYNAFIDNSRFNGISQDLYYNGGSLITIDDNWWGTNNNPYDDNARVNIDKANSWFVFNLNPEYSPLNISDSVELTAFWSLSSGVTPQIDLFPIFNVTFYTVINNEKISYQDVLTNGSCQFKFNHTQNKGSFDIIASVEGFNQSAIVDVGKTISYIKFNVSSDISYLDEFNLDLEVASNSGTPTGFVLVYLNNDVHRVDLTDGRGSLQLSNLSPNTYKIRIIYQGDEDYFKAFENTEITVKKAPVNLSVVVNDAYVGGKGSIIVSLAPKDAQGYGALYINGGRKIVNLYGGNTTINLNNYAAGRYEFTLVYQGSDKYEATNVSAVFNVFKYDTSLTIDVNDTPYGENITLKITVEPKELRGKAILSINGVNSTIFLENEVTDINLYSFGDGRYDVDVIFQGDKKYNSAKASTSFRVYKLPSNVTAEIYQDDDNLNGTILVKTTPINCTGVVGVYINYRLYKLNLSNGQAKFNVVFDKGTNYIFVFYEGDSSYESSSWNTTIGVADEFILIGENKTVFEHNNFNYTIRLIEPSGVPMPNRKLVVKLGDETYNLTTNSAGVSYLQLNLAEGEYEINTTYLNKTISNKITVKAIKFNITANNITYGEDEIIEVIFDKNVTGVAKINVNNIDVSADISEGKAIFNISSLNSGHYVVKASYSNEFFNSSMIESNFEVHRANSTLSIDIPPVCPGDNQTIKISFSKNTTGNVRITVDGISQTVNITNDEAVITISNIGDGEHSLAIYYDGNANYNPINISSSFYVKEFVTDLIITIEDGVYGQELCAIARVNETATGNVTFKVANLSKTVEIKNGLAKWSFSGVDAGKWDIEADYSGDTYFQSRTNSTSFNIGKANSSIELFTIDVCLNENIKIYANLSTNATGFVTFSMIDYYSPRNKEIINSMSVWYISPLNTGKYTVIAVYNGDKNYYSSNTTFILDVSQRKSILNVEINDAGVNDNVIVKIKLNSDNGTPISSKVRLTVDKKTYNINVGSGEGSFNMGKLSPGNYSYSVVYEGSAEYTKASVEGKFRVVDTLLTPELTSSNLTKYYSGSEGINAKLTYLGKAIVGEKVYIKINGVVYTFTSDENGEVSLPINLKPGTYDVQIKSGETKTYRSVVINVTVKVLATVEGIDVIKAYNSSDQYYAIFVDSKGKVLGNTDVKFTISGKSYTVRTLPNGVARINVNFAPGKYTISTTNPVTGEKTSNTITIFYRLAENKDLTKLYGASGAYKVRAYGDDGKPVGEGEIVKITINGVTYSCKTDKNGYASLNINLAPKTYTITALYKGYKVSNKVVIKPLLSASDISIKKSSTIPFSAKLVNSNGKPASGKVVTFKIKGKTYTAKTNSNGIASIKINLSLNVGTYSIVSTYEKSTITNKIIVKK